MARPSLSGQRHSGFLSHFLAASKSRNVKKAKRRSWRSDRSTITRPWFRLLVYALIIAAATTLVVVVIVLTIGAGSDNVDPAHKVLELTAQDIDPETTAVEKTCLNKVRSMLDWRLPCGEMLASN
jgi:hypothetical protein